MIGQTISHYRIVEKLGEGGMGIVYVAEDVVLGRRVALKTLAPRNGSSDHNFRARFLREARAVSVLSHPHIATIYDYGETDDGQPYIVMELVTGKTLAELMRAESLNIARVIEIIRQVAEALAEAHRHGIIHRDIKPSNIALNHRGEVKVLDFGLAKQIDLGPLSPVEPDRQTLLNTQTREGVIVGTPMYLSPEQALGMEVDARSDLFALGEVMYECIAGTPPFFGGTPIEIYAKVIRDDPPPPSRFNRDVPAELDRITLKALAKKPDERYQTAAELSVDLELVRAQLQGHASGRAVTRLVPPAGATQPSSALATLSDIFKRPRLSIGYVAAGLVVISLLALSVWYFMRGKPHEPTAEAKQLYEKGVSALQEGAFYQASKILGRAVAADGEFALAHARLAEALAALDDMDQAKNELLNVSRLVNRQATLRRTDALYVDAVTATVTRDLPTAIDSYLEIASINPNDPHAFIDLARAYENHDEIDKAIEQYNRAMALDHNNPAPYLGVAVLYGRRQDLADAKAAFAQAESLYRDSQNFEGRAEVSYQRGVLFSQLGQRPEANTFAQESLEVAKMADNSYQMVRALLLLSSISYSSGDTARGADLATQALGLARDNGMENLATQSLLDLGYALMIARSYEEAEHYFKQALEAAQRFKERRNQARANLLLGTLYIQREQADKGGPFIDQALTFFVAGSYRREVSRCMMMIGRKQLLQGDFEGALRTLDEQLQLAKQVEDPGQIARSQAEVAAALSKQDMYPQALVRYTESYEAYKGLTNPLYAAYAVFNRGDMLARLGRYDEATQAMSELDSYLQALSDGNKFKQIWSSWSHLSLARMYLSQRRFPEAKAESAKALATAAKDDHETVGEIRSTQGLIEVFSGERTRGRKLCEDALVEGKATSSSEHSGSLHLALAEAEIESGDAKAALNEALAAQKILSQSNQRELEWRAWLIAGRASGALSDSQAQTEQLNHAQSLLDELRRLWGIEAFAGYAARPDIRSYQEQLHPRATAL